MGRRAPASGEHLEQDGDVLARRVDRELDAARLPFVDARDEPPGEEARAEQRAAVDDDLVADGADDDRSLRALAAERRGVGRRLARGDEHAGARGAVDLGADEAEEQALDEGHGGGGFAHGMGLASAAARANRLRMSSAARRSSFGAPPIRRRAATDFSAGSASAGGNEPSAAMA